MLSSMRNNNRKVSVVSEVLNVPLSIRGGKYHLIIRVILDGGTLKVDIRNWINDRGRLFPTSKGLRLNYIDLMKIRRLEVSSRSLLLDFFSQCREFMVESSTCFGDKFKGSIIYDVVDEVIVYDLRRCYIHNVTSQLTETSRGIKLTEEDVAYVKQALRDCGYNNDLVGLIIDHLHSSFRLNTDVA